MQEFPHSIDKLSCAISGLTNSYYTLKTNKSYARFEIHIFGYVKGI